jgi:tRNA (guanine37-N1)-methyltransferase
MRFDLVTIFPEFFAGPLDHGILRRARETGLVEVQIQDLRVFTKDRHRSVDDRPFGGGEGMVLKPDPLFEAAEALLGRSLGSAEQPAVQDSKAAIVLMSAAGTLFRQETARRYAQLDRIVLLCGRYEGVDERVAEYLATEEISVGDYVLSGGELPAMLIIDAVTRLVPGALGNEASSQNESFSENPAFSPVGARHAVPVQPDTEFLAVRGAGGALRETSGQASPAPTGGKPLSDKCSVLLDFPHYTRPADFRGWKVPDVLIGGNHAEVANWRRAAALEKTQRNRPDLLLR